MTPNDAASQRANDPIEVESTAATLRISIVVYDTPHERLTETLASARAAVTHAVSDDALAEATLRLVDNGAASGSTASLRMCASETWWGPGCGSAKVVCPEGNIGYGRGNNLALADSTAEFVLVLNPDVTLDAAAITNAVRYLRAQAGVALVAPRVTGPDGTRQYLCKRYPSLMVLLLRGLMPGFAWRLFPAYMARYELRSVTEDHPVAGPWLVSGCCMLMRRSAFEAAGGFSRQFFLYFEDTDLSLRIARIAQIAYVPTVRIVHHGGGAAHKGIRHIALFAISGWRFFRRHGWRWASLQGPDHLPPRDST